jgi:hypothetical protein
MRNLVQTFTFKLILVIAITTLFCSCGKKELDRETAMRLVQGQGAQRIELDFTSLDFGTTNQHPSYQELEKAGILVCHRAPEPGARKCVPSSTSGIRVIKDYLGPDLVLFAGTVAPTAVTGVTETGPNSATASVQFSLQAAPTYEQHQAAFQVLYRSANPTGPLIERIQPSVRLAAFQRYDDGWRFQGFQ